MTYRETQNHGSIEEVLPDIFMVTGTNVAEHEGISYQFSRNMVIVREKGLLSMINSVRLDESGLEKIESLGKVTDVLRIGSYHGYDNAFYVDRYGAQLWEIEGMPAENDRSPDQLLGENRPLPQTSMSLFLFRSCKLPEAAIFLNLSGGIVITCDSIFNWTEPDEFFSVESAEFMKKAGFFGPAVIGVGWRQTCKGLKDDFERFQKLPYQHLICAHGPILRNKAHGQFGKTLDTEFGIK